MVSEASMDLLNSKLDEKLEIERFRPNIIVSGCSPHDEVPFQVLIFIFNPIHIHRTTGRRCELGMISS